MAYCFPTSEDTALLVAFVHQSADQLKSSDVHRLRQAEVDDDDNVIASVSRSEDDDGDLSEVLKCTCDAIVATTEESSKFFGSPDAGPVVSPSQFAQSTIGHLVQLNTKAKQLQKQLLAEGREHGLSFAPDATKRAYGKFSDAIYAVVQWTTSALKFAEGRGDRDGRPVGHGENVHDVVPLYAAFYENSQLYFLQECTLFDPRIQRRILMPAYFHALRDHILSLRKEIDRLLSVDEVLQRSTVGAARFHPPIQDFSFLLESLQFYLAVSVVEDDLTTVTYYRILYDAVKRETQAVAERLAQLPNDANSSSPSPSSSAAATVADTTPRTGDAFRSGPLSSPSSIATATGATATGGVPSSPLRATPSPHEQCSAAFAAFDEVRHRVLELQSNIKKDIDAKNQTHKTRAAGVTLAKQQQGGPSSPSVAVAAAALHQQAAASSAGWWSSIKSASSRLLCGAADVVTCRAEIFPTETDADGVPLSATSPLASKKLELLERVNLLVAAVEAIADGLEAQYPNVYHRDFFSRLQKSANRVIQHLESMTVVFKGSF